MDVTDKIRYCVSILGISIFSFIVIGYAFKENNQLRKENEYLKVVCQEKILETSEVYSKSSDNIKKAIAQSLKSNHKPAVLTITIVNKDGSIKDYCIGEYSVCNNNVEFKASEFSPEPGKILNMKDLNWGK